MKELMQTIRMPVQEFGVCLKQILKSKRMSASELARTMAYKSRNSIFRILDEEGGHGVRRAFCERLIEEDPLWLTQEEKLALWQALEVSRVGRQAFLNNAAMRELLMNAGEKNAARGVRIDMHGVGEKPGFGEALSRIVQGEAADLTIIGCCDRAIFDALREWIQEKGPSCKVKIRHFIYTGEGEIVHNISAIQPLLYFDFYTAYCVEPGVFSRERENIYRQNCMYIHTQDKNGTWYGQPLVLVDKGVFMPLTRARVDEKNLLTQYFESTLEQMPLLKEQFSGVAGMADYLAYTKSCQALEMNRAIYTIKLDVPLNFIDPKILLPCLKEEFKQMAGEREEEVIGELERIHLERWDNIFKKNKVTHTIFSKEAMRRFAETGRQSDHFFAFRAYKPEERVKILSAIRDQAQEKENFRIYFFKEDFEPPLTEIGLYEGKGTLMTKPYTHYDLGDHSETIIKQKEFCECYKAFYMKVLLERHVISPEETLAYMDELIKTAKGHQ